MQEGQRTGTASASGAEEDFGNAKEDLAYGGIISQVTSRGAPTTASTASRPAASFNVQPGRAPPAVPGFSLASIFCCFNPEREGYVKANAGGRYPSPQQRRPPSLLGPLAPGDSTKKTLVLDLDETLVHSSFKPVPNPDFIIPVDIDGKSVDVFVLKRPWCDHFLARMGEMYEVVVFTASLAKYADPLLDLLDKGNVIRWRLFRESCVLYEGNYVKNLATLGRKLKDIVIIDNSPHSYVFQPENSMPVSTFIDDMEDRELLDLLPMLAQVEMVDDVRLHLERVCSHARTSNGGRLEPILPL